MIEYRIATRHDRETLIELVKQIDHSFPVPVSDKTNIDEYVEKLLQLGGVYMATDDGKAVGMCGFYANNFTSCEMYLSILGVLDIYRRKGIAKKLFADSMLLGKGIGMKTCRLFTHRTNFAAISMYRSLGFTMEQSRERPEDISFVKAL